MNNYFRLILSIVSATLILFTPIALTAQYRASFGTTNTSYAENNLPGWRTATGDGHVIFKQKTENGKVVLQIDPRNDKRNVWYAFMHQSISESIDIEKLKLPGYELRMEARVKASHAPRRINMYLTSLDAGGFLREFDLQEKEKWYTISMVTEGFKFDPKLPLMTQVSLMDWGISDVFELSIDYIKVDLIKTTDTNLPQYGLPLVYRPELKAASFYSVEIPVSANATIDKSFPDEPLYRWIFADKADTVQVIQVDQSKTALLKWELSQYRGKKADGAGQLEITTYSIARRDKSPKDFGEIRFSEINNQPAPWDERSVTQASFLNGVLFHEVVNSQCIIDSSVTSVKGGKTVVTISQSVLQRLIDGKSSGIAIKPLGLISASFYDRTDQKFAAKLRFNIKN